MKPTSAHAIQNYLGLSKTSIYSYLKNLKAYNSINITARLVEANNMKQSLKQLDALQRKSGYSILALMWRNFNS